MLKKSTPLALLVPYLAAAGQPALCQTHYLEAGIQNFNMGQFAASMYEFKNAETANPRDPIVHYYMGASLARMDRLDEAMAEFQKAYQLSQPKSAVRHLSMVALATYGQRVNAASAGREGTAKDGAAAKDGSAPNGDADKVLHIPPPPVPTEPLGG